MRGGKRDGAGRPSGAITRASREAIRVAEHTGEMPRDYMLRVMRDPKADPARRDDMAKAVAPYFHHRLSSIEHGNNPDNPLTNVTAVERHIIDPRQEVEDTDAEGVPALTGPEDVQGR